MAPKDASSLVAAMSHLHVDFVTEPIPTTCRHFQELELTTQVPWPNLHHRETAHRASRNISTSGSGQPDRRLAKQLAPLVGGAFAEDAGIVVVLPDAGVVDVSGKLVEVPAGVDGDIAVMLEVGAAI